MHGLKWGKMMKDRNKHRREHTRRTAFIIVEYSVKEGVFRDLLRNIGARGVFISTKRRIKPDQPIELKFPLFEFEHVIKMRGQIVRSTPHGFAVVFENPIPALICKENEMPDIVHEIDRDKEGQ